MQRDLASQQEAALAHAEQASAQAQTQVATQILSSYGLTPGRAQDVNDASDTGQGARLTIRKPISGHVLGRNAIFGPVVAAQTQLATLADFDEAYDASRAART